MSRAPSDPRRGAGVPVALAAVVLPLALLVSGCAGSGAGGASPSAGRSIHDLPPGVDRAPGREDPVKAEDVPLPETMPTSLPDPATLLRWTVPDTGKRFGVDPATYTRVNTNAARLIVVIETSGGARNVTMEGIRCDTAERKLLAVGRSDGTWSLPPNPAWLGLIRTDALLRDRRPLLRALCDGPTSAEDAKRLARRLEDSGVRY